MREGAPYKPDPERLPAEERPKNKTPKEKKSALERLRGKARLAAFTLSGIAGAGALAVESGRAGADLEVEEPEAGAVEAGVSEFPRSAELFRTLLGFRQKGPGDGVESPERQEGAADSLNKLVRDAIANQAGAAIAQSCKSAQQCYMFYDGQLDFTPEARAALAEASGMTEEELDFCRDVMQKGYLIAPGLRFSGTVMQRDEVGYRNFPSIMSEAEKKRFYDEVLYPRHVAMIKEHLRRFGILDLSEEDQRAIKELLADLVKAVTEAEVAALHLDVVYANFKNYRRTRQYEEARFKERDDFVQRIEKLVDRLFETYADCKAGRADDMDIDALKSGMKQAVKRREHTHRLALYQNLLEQLRKDWTTRMEAPKFEERIDGELTAIRDIDAKLAKISAGRIVLAKK